MQRVLRLARKGAGWVNPNPMVGALVVKDCQIIGEGYHARFGGPHAEVAAIADAMAPVEGASLVVNLEPCIHHGKTPPCAPLIVEKGIRHVIVGMKDPNPLVNGQGIDYLRKHGIEVETGILEEECKALNEVFIHFITTGLPFVTLKWAMTLDGKTGTVTGASRWISGEAARRRVHRYRQELSAVMTGINTVITDDPLLNTRLGGRKVHHPLKIIADTHGRIPPDAQVLKHDPQLTIVATTELAGREKRRTIERLGAQVLLCPLKDGRVDLEYLMHSLGTMGVDSILIEGGSSLAASALKDGIVNKVVAVIAPKILGGEIAPTPVGGEGITDPGTAIPVHRWKFRKIGNDLMIEGTIK